jgi:hypothetical protein
LVSTPQRADFKRRLVFYKFSHARKFVKAKNKYTRIAERLVVGFAGILLRQNLSGYWQLGTKADIDISISGLFDLDIQIIFAIAELG